MAITATATQLSISNEPSIESIVFGDGETVEIESPGFLWSTGAITPAITLTAPSNSEASTTSYDVTLTNGSKTANASKSINVAALVTPVNTPKSTKIKIPSGAIGLSEIKYTVVDGSGESIANGPLNTSHSEITVSLKDDSNVQNGELLFVFANNSFAELDGDATVFWHHAKAIVEEE